LEHAMKVVEKDLRTQNSVADWYRWYAN